jgi:hypothetical protein
MVLALAVEIAGGHGPRAQTDTETPTAIRSLSNGLVTVDSLDLPEPFLRHVIDWELRGSWREANHQIQLPTKSATALHDQKSMSGPSPGVAARPTIMTPASLAIDQPTMDTWLGIAFGVPELRGFRVPIGTGADDPWPFALLQRDADDPQAQRYRRAATFVATHLAREGLIRTVMRLVRAPDMPGPWVDGETLKLNRLRAVGVPIDLLTMLTVDDGPAPRAIAAWMRAGANVSDIDSIASRARFEFQSSWPGFVIMAEDGSQPVSTLRLQLPTNRFRDGGVGDGSVLDVFRQLAIDGSQMPMIVSIHRDAVDGLVAEFARWNVPEPERIVIAPQPANVTQWAQDNAKSGCAAPIREGSRPRPRSVMLTPRYASRTELRSVCVPTDSLAMEELRRGFEGSLQVIHSPLLFQGGNLMAVVDPRTRQRWLLIGEAEVHRNHALGLSQAQVLEAFKLEFGVDRCEMIPAASFHIDLDFTIRGCGEELVACVIDDVAGARLIVAESIRALASAGVIAESQSARLVGAVIEGGPNAGAAAIAIRKAIDPTRDSHGVLSSQLAEAFMDSSKDPSPQAGVDAARRFLVALDIVTADAMTDAQLADTSSGPSPLLRQYLAALRRQRAKLDELAARLQRLGMRVHRIPGTSDHEVSVNPVNGLHLGDCYLMPAYDGPFQAVDDAAVAAFKMAFGSTVRIEIIRTAAVQSTDGGLHCLVGLIPAAD